MFEIRGKYNTALVFADVTDSDSVAQVLAMCNTEYLKDSRIRMMPDMHASAGCTVGTSMTVHDKVNPAFVGGDIGCGMQTYRLRETEIDFAHLDDAIRTFVPSGAKIHAEQHPRLAQLGLENLHCYRALRHETVGRSLGTLGGGNHFIEIGRGVEGNVYLVIHSGSRRLGRDIARYYQDQAFYQTNGIDPEIARKRHVQHSEIENFRLPRDESYLSGELLSAYLDDMRIGVAYAQLNREIIGEEIIARLGLHAQESFATIHNYIDTEHGVLRKGAVSAQKDEMLIVPINMRDGSLICRGRGNEDWNCTAPHGSGRLMTRSEAKSTLSMAAYREAMQGIFTTSVNESTLDESPMAYRRIESIVDTIDPTAEIVNIISPLYNFKASKLDVDAETMDGLD